MAVVLVSPSFESLSGSLADPWRCRRPVLIACVILRLHCDVEVEVENGGSGSGGGGDGVVSVKEGRMEGVARMSCLLRIGTRC